MSDQPKHPDRREALRRIAAAAAFAAAGPPQVAAETRRTAAPPSTGPRGTPTDPDLLHPTTPWPRQLSAGERRMVSVLADLIIPADTHSSAASSVGVPDFIDEYVSAPYDSQRRDLVQIRGGLAWLNSESDRRFTRPFVELSSTQQHQICDDICHVPSARPEYRQAAQFFARFRDLTATGFYTTDAGMKDLRFVGNIARPRWDGPPPEVLRHAGLE